MKMEMNVFSMPRLHEKFHFDDERVEGWLEGRMEELLSCNSELGMMRRGRERKA
jgi:hypothetical protein